MEIREKMRNEKSFKVSEVDLEENPDYSSILLNTEEGSFFLLHFSDYDSCKDSFRFFQELIKFGKDATFCLDKLFRESNSISQIKHGSTILYAREII